MLLYWALVFLMMALVAAVFGFELVSTGAGWLAQVVFLSFLVLAFTAFVSNLARPRVP